LLKNLGALNKMAKKKKRGGKSNLALNFMTFSEIEKLGSAERIKKLLNIILKKRIVVLQGRLKAEEEIRLIEDTMAMVDHVREFKGIELAVISPKTERSFFSNFKHGIAKALVGDTESLTVIGPASIVKEVKKDPSKIELLLK